MSVEKIPPIHVTGDNIRRKMQTNSKCETFLEVITEEETTLTRKKQTTNLKYWTAYSKISMHEAEKRLGFRFVEFEMYVIHVGLMLAQAMPCIKGLKNKQVQKTKEMGFENIIRYVEGEGFPTEFDKHFDEAIMNNLVLLIILSILTDLKCETGRNLLLRREKVNIAASSKMRGFWKIVKMDFIRVGNKMFGFVVEAKKSTVGQAKKQCLLALKDIGDNNDAGIMYGFVTSGGQWQMIQNDSRGFIQTDRFQVLFGRMGLEKERWMKERSVMVDFIHMALRSRGLVAP
ncbi:hypothetical protein HOY82DRAFT_541260 [Tuber indicum]|nr:hypothetical protein HOY82DRAFT_541260 [Tuber indicum]